MPQSPSTSPSHSIEPVQNSSSFEVSESLTQGELLDPSAETAASQPNREIAAKPRNRWSAFVWLFRLLVLGTGGSVAVVAGMAIAHFYPAQTQEIPFVQRLLHSSDAVMRQLERLPQIWQGGPDAPSASVSADPSSTTSTPDAASLSLTPVDRQKLQNELRQLQQELEQINDRATAIENRLGTPNRSSEIAARLQAIQQQLDPSAARPNAPASPNSATVPPAAPSTVSQDDRLLVTLPSDALFESNQFEADQTTLKPGTEAILDSIVNDLKQYPGATIRVTGHLDQQSTESADRERSFQQAKAIEQYLGGQLKEGYHWLVEGYGHSRPLSANDTPVNRQRNRRIEIVIEPK